MLTLRKFNCLYIKSTVFSIIFYLYIFQMCCLTNKTYNKNVIQYYTSELYFSACSDALPNCNKCSSTVTDETISIDCTECFEGFYTITTTGITCAGT